MNGFSISLTLQIVPVAFVVVLLVVAFIRNQSARQEQTQGVLWLQAMRMLITHIQRHRGLSSGVLSGDQKLRPQLEEIQLQVSRDFDQISGVGDWIKAHSGWISITQHWARLAGNLPRLKVDRNMDQHNKLIKNILVLVDEIAIQHHLSSHNGFRSNIWHELLTLAELVGQVRAVGTVIAAHADDEDRLVINSRKELQALVQEILATLESQACRQGLDSELLQDILNFLSFVDTCLIGEGPMVTASSYYDAASKVVDLIFERFDEELSVVNRRLMRT